MRLLFLLALLLNVAFLAWMLTKPPAAPEPILSTGKNADPLVLLRERDSAPRRGPEKPDSLAARPQNRPVTSDRVVETKSQEPPPPQPFMPSVTCATLGPFATSQEAADAAGMFSRTGIQVHQRVHESPELSGYWVYLPPYKTRERAQEVARELGRRGLTDFFVVTAAGRENAVSLGVFKAREAAERRRAEVAKLGFSPALDERFHTRFEYWLDYSVSGDAPPLNELHAKIRQDHADVKATRRNCE